MKKKSPRQSPAMMESLEGRQLLSGSHVVSPTKLTFSTSAVSGPAGSPISITFAAKITSNGLPLRTATVYFVIDNKTAVAQGVSGRSGYVTATAANIFPGQHILNAYFLGATRY